MLECKFSNETEENDEVINPVTFAQYDDILSSTSGNLFHSSGSQSESDHSQPRVMGLQSLVTHGLKISLGSKKTSSKGRGGKMSSKSSVSTYHQSPAKKAATHQQECGIVRPPLIPPHIPCVDEFVFPSDLEEVEDVETENEKVIASFSFTPPLLNPKTVSPKGRGLRKKRKLNR